MINSEDEKEFKYPLFRDVQCRFLKSFITSESRTSAPALIIHGYKSTGKSYTVQEFLNHLSIKNTIIKCDECITKKLLLQRCLRQIRIDSGVDLENYKQVYKYKGNDVSSIGKLCETVTSFIMALEQFIADNNYTDNHVLVLDRFDQCMDPTNELFAALLNMQEQTKVKNISIIFIITGEDPKEILTKSIPHIYFNPYTQEEVTEIFRINQFCHFENDLDSSNMSKEYWKQYCKMIVDLFFYITGSDIVQLMNICITLWSTFSNPILSGKYELTEFIKVYKENISTIEKYLMAPKSNDNDESSEVLSGDIAFASMGNLPIHSKYILIASYLASFNEPKNDPFLFSKVNGLKKKKSKSKKGVRIRKEDVSATFFSPNYFDLERLLAILNVIYRNDALDMKLSGIDPQVDPDYERTAALREQEHSKYSVSSSIDINSQIATLVSLGLLTRTFALDVLSPKIRWKCNINWEMVSTLARGISFPIENYMPNEI